MTRRILLVGPEQPLWQDCREQSQDPASGWTVEIAADGRQALERIEQKAFDAVVADAELPGMEGVDLLDHVTACDPGVVRVVLSDVGDARGTVSCAGRAHRHLFKPCDATAVFHALTQGFALEALVPSGTVRLLIGQMRWLPSPPAIYSRILAEMHSPTASVERIGDLVAEDPAIAAKVLQLANSAVFGLQLEVIHPAEAITYIGLETTRALIMLAHTFSSFDQLHCAGFSADALWRHSLRTGQLARRIASIEGAGTETTEQSFSAGLLHDIGKLLFAANLPGPFGQALALARTQQCSLWKAESRVLGASHPEVGAHVLGIWGLPLPIIEAVALHHSPIRSTSQQFCPLTAVHAANAILHHRKR